MTNDQTKKIGYACAYTPLTIIDAAGYTPFRILPMTDAPDFAGSVLHDNMCPHIKRLLDRALAKDLPDLAGMVFVNSCDAMRRLADAWQKVRPQDPVILIDLPTTQDERAIAFLAGELSRLADTLAGWSGLAIENGAILASTERYNTLYGLLNELRERNFQGRLNGGGSNLQSLYNQVSTIVVSEAIGQTRRLLAEPPLTHPDMDAVPVYLLGHVLPDPAAFDFLESCGVRITADDLCTGSRLLAAVDLNGPGNIFYQTATSLITKPACARTFDPGNPIKIAEQTLAQAKDSGARGAIGHTVKFCDLYLARLPVFREVFRDNGMPLLLIEGDCTLRSIGQQRTRVEAFVEMLR